MLTLRVAETVALTPLVRSLRLVLADAADGANSADGGDSADGTDGTISGGMLPGYAPGAHIQVEIPGTPAPGGPVREGQAAQPRAISQWRSYSLVNFDPASSATAQVSEYRLGIRLEDEGGGGSRFMHALAVGDTLRARAPVNHFPLVVPPVVSPGASSIVPPVVSLGASQAVPSVTSPFASPASSSVTPPFASSAVPSVASPFASPATSLVTSPFASPAAPSVMSSIAPSVAPPVTSPVVPLAPILIAGGIGITPIASMAAHLVAEGRDFALHYSARSFAQMPFVAELQALALTRLVLHTDDSPTRFAPDALLAQATPGQPIYVCGPPGMIDATLAAARKLGWREDALHYERFTEAAPRTGDATLAALAAFEVELKSSGKVIRVAAGQSLLDALLDAGVDVMYDCRAGYCGLCTVNVCGGPIEHRDTYLSDADKASGKLMQPCVSRMNVAQAGRTERLVLDL